MSWLLFVLLFFWRVDFLVLYINKIGFGFCWWYVALESEAMGSRQRVVCTRRHGYTVCMGEQWWWTTPLMEFCVASAAPTHGLPHLTNASSILHNRMSHNYLIHACVCASHRILQLYYSYCSLISFCCGYVFFCYVVACFQIRFSWFWIVII